MFILLHFDDSGDPLYININQIDSFHRDQGSSNCTVVNMRGFLGDEGDGYYTVKETPETIAGLISLMRGE